MNKLLIIFIILVLGLILANVLGIFNIVEGFSSANAVTFKGIDGVGEAYYDSYNKQIKTNINNMDMVLNYKKSQYMDVKGINMLTYVFDNSGNVDSMNAYTGLLGITDSGSFISITKLIPPKTGSPIIKIFTTSSKVSIPGTASANGSASDSIDTFKMSNAYTFNNLNKTAQAYYDPVSKTIKAPFGTDTKIFSYNNKKQYVSSQHTYVFTFTNGTDEAYLGIFLPDDTTAVKTPSSTITVKTSPIPVPYFLNNKVPFPDDVDKSTDTPKTDSSGNFTKSELENMFLEFMKKYTNSTKEKDTYNHYTGTSLPSIFYGPDGSIARIIQTGTNDTVVVITFKNGNTEIYYISSDKTAGNTKKFYGPNNSNATIGTNSQGKYTLVITTKDGKAITYDAGNSYNYKSTDSSSKNYYENTKDTTSNYDSAFTLDKSTAKSFDDKSGYNSDLYMLKSQVFPFVATYNPWIKYEKSDSKKDKDNDVSSNSPDWSKKCSNDTSTCPTTCANYNNNDYDYDYGSQDTFFTYKRVPNYGAMDNSMKPVPVLANFSTFGM